MNAAPPAGAKVYLMAQIYRRGVGLATSAMAILAGASIVSRSEVQLLLGMQTR